MTTDETRRSAPGGTSKHNPDPDAERRLLEAAVARLRAGVMAVVFGMTTGVGLFGATVWLVIKGGPNVGKHLSLLSNYFPGYSVTWVGAFLGLIYGALLGGALGWLLAFIYNRIATRRFRD